MAKQGTQHKVCLPCREANSSKHLGTSVIKQRGQDTSRHTKKDVGQQPGTRKSQNMQIGQHTVPLAEQKSRQHTVVKELLQEQQPVMSCVLHRDNNISGG